MIQSVVIAGGGHAAGQTIVSLRQGGFGGRICLIGEEPYLPYQRPPLSKKFLAGEIDVPRLLLRQEKFYTDHEIELHLGTRVTGVDRAAATVALSTGGTVAYDRLVLATGSQVRRMTVPGSTLAGIHYLRTIEDVDRIRDDFHPGARLVVVGAGYIGLEVAAVAVTRGLDVTVVEYAPIVMPRVAAPPVSAFFERVHRQAGVKIHCGTGVAGFRGSARVQGVTLSDGRELPADLAIVGVGILPCVDIAQAADIACTDGITVDEFCQTADEKVLAIGDCTNHPNRLLGCRLRLESVHNAQEQAKTAAATILGRREAYAEIPWFWSDQYDLKLQIAGFSRADQRAVVRGDPESRSFAVFFLDDDGRMTAVYGINSPKEFMLSRKLIAIGARPDPAELADTGKPFRIISDALTGAADKGAEPAPREAGKGAG